jgi:CheY-like chemotaxis protein
MASRIQLISASNGPARILIVEDDLLIATEMKSVLEEAGAEVVAVARNVAEALERCRALQPALALIDVELAGANDGIELACQLSEREGVRAIFVTGHSDPKSVARAASAKPISWIKKPFGPGSIVAGVALALKELQSRPPG